MFGVAVDRRRSESMSMSMNACSAIPGRTPARAARATRCSRRTDSSWRLWPKVNSRSNVPMVDGAYTEPKRCFIPPDRSTSMSSILSAPAHIAAIRVVNFGAKFAAPDVIFGAAIETLSASSSLRPVWSARAMIGSSPAHETRWSSSNFAESGWKVWDDRTGSVLLVWSDLLCENSNLPSSEGAFVSSTPRYLADLSVDRG